MAEPIHSDPVVRDLDNLIDERDRLKQENVRLRGSAVDEERTYGELWEHANDLGRQLESARRWAVHLEQQNAAVREYAERCERSDNTAYAKAGRELLAILDNTDPDDAYRGQR